MSHRFSIYTSRVIVNLQVYLYNSFSDNLIALSEEIDNLVLSHWDDVDKLQSIHSDLYSTLLEDRFIVEKCTEEWNDVIQTWCKEDNSPLKYTLIINPTLNCNMKCWYCYEQHDKTTYISNEVLSRIYALIEKKVNCQKLQGLNIDFFGGEPLLNYRNGVYPILERAYAECIKHGKQLYISFTTNGYLLTSNTINELSKYARWGKIRLQITLDGNENLHNKTRALDGYKPTYQTIIQNIIGCAEHDFQVLVRLNYTRNNILSFYDVIDSFTQIEKKTKCNLTFSFHKVWQAMNSPQLEKDLHNVQEAFLSNGFTVERNTMLSPNRCYGDKNNTAVINYNGDVFKCTARNFTKTHREGILSPEGEVIWNEQNELRRSLNYGTTTCKRCKIYPICHGGCSQTKLENRHITDCYKGWSPIQIDRFLADRVAYLSQKFSSDE